MSRQQVLNILKSAGEEYISGEKISASLGVSRAAVWKDIEALRQQGYVIDSVTRKGYRLVSVPDNMTVEEVSPVLDSELLRERLIVLDCIDSTNNYAKKIAMEGAPDCTAILANEQTGGRGRLGRSFQSPRGAGIYLTMLFRPDRAPMEAVNLTAYVAVAVCDGIEAACGVRPGIKWTNDIVLGGRKLCGILTEMAVEGESGMLEYVITGIGINVQQQMSDFPDTLQEIATSLSIQVGHPVNRAQVSGEIINALRRMYLIWLQGGGDYKARYRKDCLTLGKEVRVIRGSTEYTAFAEDLDEDLGLIVRKADGTRETVTSGEVSVRGLFGYV